MKRVDVIIRDIIDVEIETSEFDKLHRYWLTDFRDLRINNNQSYPIILIFCHR